MTIIRLSTQIGGYRDGRAWPPSGCLVELPKHEAEPFVMSGYGTVEESPAEGEIIHWSEGNLDHAEPVNEPDAPAEAEQVHATPISEGGDPADLVTKQDLLDEAERRGIEVKKSWTVTKIQQALEG